MLNASISPAHCRACGSAARRPVMDSPLRPPGGERCCAPRDEPAEVFLFSLSEPVQPTGSRRPSNAAPLLKRPPPPPGRRHPAGSPPFTGGRPASVERRCRSPDLCVLGRRLTKRRPPGHLENSRPPQEGGRRGALSVSPAAIEQRGCSKIRGREHSMNTITVVGNLTRDPELRYTPDRPG